MGGLGSANFEQNMVKVYIWSHFVNYLILGYTPNPTTFWPRRGVRPFNAPAPTFHNSTNLFDLLQVLLSHFHKIFIEYPVMQHYQKKKN